MSLFCIRNVRSKDQGRRSHPLCTQNMPSSIQRARSCFYVDRLWFAAWWWEGNLFPSAFQEAEERVVSINTPADSLRGNITVCVYSNSFFFFFSFASSIWLKGRENIQTGVSVCTQHNTMFYSPANGHRGRTKGDVPSASLVKQLEGNYEQGVRGTQDRFEGQKLLERDQPVRMRREYDIITSAHVIILIRQLFQASSIMLSWLWKPSPGWYILFRESSGHINHHSWKKTELEMAFTPWSILNIFFWRWTSYY